VRSIDVWSSPVYYKDSVLKCETEVEESVFTADQWGSIVVWKLRIEI
jgi:hypothetical protein